MQISELLRALNTHVDSSEMGSVDPGKRYPPLLLHHPKNTTRTQQPHKRASLALLLFLQLLLCVLMKTQRTSPQKKSLLRLRSWRVGGKSPSRGKPESGNNLATLTLVFICSNLPDLHGETHARPDLRLSSLPHFIPGMRKRVAMKFRKGLLGTQHLPRKPLGGGGRNKVMPHVNRLQFHCSRLLLILPRSPRKYVQGVSKLTPHGE